MALSDNQAAFKFAGIYKTTNANGISMYADLLKDGDKWLSEINLELKTIYLFYGVIKTGDDIPSNSYINLSTGKIILFINSNATETVDLSPYSLYSCKLECTCNGTTYNLNSTYKAVLYGTTWSLFELSSGATGSVVAASVSIDNTTVLDSQPTGLISIDPNNGAINTLALELMISSVNEQHRSDIMYLGTKILTLESSVTILFFEGIIYDDITYANHLLSNTKVYFSTSKNAFVNVFTDSLGSRYSFKESPVSTKLYICNGIPYVWKDGALVVVNQAYALTDSVTTLTLAGIGDYSAGLPTSGYESTGLIYYSTSVKKLVLKYEKITSSGLIESKQEIYAELDEPLSTKIYLYDSTPYIWDSNNKALIALASVSLIPLFDTITLDMIPDSLITPEKLDREYIPISTKVEWSTSLDLDNIIGDGLYRILGIRLGTGDNLPIYNVGRQIDGKLIVTNSSEDGNNLISLLLILNNIGGHDSKLFTRHYYSTDGWTMWEEKSGMKLVNTVSYDDMAGYKDNGMYSGVFLNVKTNSETYNYVTGVLIVVNNYAIASAAGLSRSVVLYLIGNDLNSGELGLLVRRFQDNSLIPTFSLGKLFDNLYKLDYLQVKDRIELNGWGSKCGLYIGSSNLDNRPFLKNWDWSINWEDFTNRMDSILELKGRVTNIETALEKSEEVDDGSYSTFLTVSTNALTRFETYEHIGASGLSNPNLGIGAGTVSMLNFGTVYIKGGNNYDKESIPILTYKSCDGDVISRGYECDFNKCNYDAITKVLPFKAGNTFRYYMYSLNLVDFSFGSKSNIKWCSKLNIMVLEKNLPETFCELTLEDLPSSDDPKYYKFFRVPKDNNKPIMLKLSTCDYSDDISDFTISTDTTDPDFDIVKYLIKNNIYIHLNLCIKEYN